MEKQTSSHKNWKGFTLLELIVALVIIVILAAATIPSLRSMLSDSRIKSAAENFIQLIQLARSSAFKNQQNVYLNFQAGSSWCSGVNAGSSCNCKTSGNCGLSVISSSDYSSITSNIDSGFTNGSFYFDWVRGLPSQAVEVSFQADNKKITVNVNATGEISVCSTNVAGYTAC